MAENKQRKRFDDINRDLCSILSTYPTLQMNHIKKITPIYYPIAILDVTTLERSFEDFETIELIILKLFANGIQSPMVMSQLLSLSLKYVQKIIKLLYGYGHLSNDCLTELGWESLKKEQKIELKQGKQKLQVNALTGQVLIFHELINQKQLDDINEYKFSVAHLFNMDGVQTQDLIQQIKGDNYANFIESGKNQIVNLEQIVDIEFSEMGYAYCCLLEFDNQNPMIFTQRLDKTKFSIKEKCKWLPLSVPTNDIRNELRLSDSVFLTTDYEKEQVKNALAILKEKHEYIYQQNRKIYIDCACEFYPFDLSTITVKNREDGGCDFYVSEASFKEYNDRVLRMLEFMDTKKLGKYYLQDYRFYGNAVCIIPNSEALIKTTLKLRIRMDEYGRNRVKNAVRNYFEQNENQENVIQNINKALDKMDRLNDEEE